MGRRIEEEKYWKGESGEERDCRLVDIERKGKEGVRS